MSSHSVADEPDRVGVWLIGARGSVATTAIVGAAALAARLLPSTGLVTELPPLREASFVPFESMVFGGHDVVETPLVKRAESLAEGGVFSRPLLDATRSALEHTDAEIRLGYRVESGGGESITTAIDRLRGDIVDFVRRHQVTDLVVVNLSSVEAVAAADMLTLSRAELIDRVPQSAVPVSIVYALAAIDAGGAYVDFTPSAALLSDAVREAATQAGVPIAGRDGKTGETLVKSVLAPMFARRNLRVRSWAGTNLLGGGDGATLAEPNLAAAKLSSKSASLESALGYPVTAPLHIDHLEDAGEWKTAWDHIAFEGFFGARMTLQFTWHGCDSALAAPLVLDLVRLLVLARRRHEHGELPQLGFFFKDPIGSDQHALDVQFHQLCTWVGGSD